MTQPHGSAYQYVYTHLDGDPHGYTCANINTNASARYAYAYAYPDRSASCRPGDPPQHYGQHGHGDGDDYRAEFPDGLFGLFGERAADCLQLHAYDYGRSVGAGGYSRRLL
jgi:hypothetical protein